MPLRRFLSADPYARWSNTEAVGTRRNSRLTWCRQRFFAARESAVKTYIFIYPHAGTAGTVWSGSLPIFRTKTPVFCAVCKLWTREAYARNLYATTANRMHLDAISASRNEQARERTWTRMVVIFQPYVYDEHCWRIRFYKNFNDVSYLRSLTQIFFSNPLTLFRVTTIWGYRCSRNQ